MSGWMRTRIAHCASKAGVIQPKQTTPPDSCRFECKVQEWKSRDEFDARDPTQEISVLNKNIQNRHYHRQASVLLTQILFVAPLCVGSWWRWLPFLPILLPLVHNHALIPAWLCRFFNSLNPLDAACRFGRSAIDLRISFFRLWNHALPGVFFREAQSSQKQW